MWSQTSGEAWPLCPVTTAGVVMDPWHAYRKPMRWILLCHTYHWPSQIENAGLISVYFPTNHIWQTAVLEDRKETAIHGPQLGGRLVFSSFLYIIFSCLCLIILFILIGFLNFCLTAFSSLVYSILFLPHSFLLLLVVAVLLCFLFVCCVSVSRRFVFLLLLWLSSSLWEILHTELSRKGF